MTVSRECFLCGIATILFIVAFSICFFSDSSAAGSYSVSYVTNGGTEIPGETYDGSEDHYLQISYRSGFRLEWTDNEGLTGDPIEYIPQGSVGDRTFYARWTEVPKYVATFDSDSGTSVITGLSPFWIDTLTDEDRANITVDIPNKLMGDNNREYTVVGIGDNAFESDINGFLNTYYGCKITNLNLSQAASLTIIGSYAFYQCTGVTSNISFHNAPTVVKNYAFESIGGTIDSESFDCISVIGDYAFANCNFSLPIMDIHKEIQSIGSNAFAYSNIEYLSIYNPDSYRNIMPFTFARMHNCKSVSISGIESIGESAFLELGSRSSSNVHISAGTALASIGASAFKDSGSVGHSFTFNILDSVISIGTGAFENLGSKSNPIGNNHIDVSIGLPNNPSFTSIPNNMFYGGSYTREINYPSVKLTIPSNVTAIGDSAFYKTNSEIYLHGNIESVGINGLSATSKTYLIAPDKESYETYRGGCLLAYAARLTYPFTVTVDATDGRFENNGMTKEYTFLYGMSRYAFGSTVSSVSSTIVQNGPVPIPIPTKTDHGIREWIDELTMQPVENLDSGTYRTRIYAVWGPDSLTDITFQAYSGTYDGTEHTITASSRHGVTDETPTSYTWYRITDGTPNYPSTTPDGTYVVKYVSDSGTYRCKMTLGGYIAWTDDITVQITRKEADIGPINVHDKTYDRTVNASFENNFQLNGIVGGDIVSVNPGTATFSDLHSGSDKTVSFYGFSITGPDADNYVLTNQPNQAKASVLPKEVTISVNEVNSKVYDGNVSGTFEGTALHGVINGDAVTVTEGTAAFDSKRAGTRTVSFSGFGISGTDSADYVLNQQPSSHQSEITRLPVIINGAGVLSKTYDGTKNATLGGTPTLSKKIDGDDVQVRNGTVSFLLPYASNAAVAVFKGFTLVGNDAENYYLLSQPESVTSEILRKEVTIEGMSVLGKTYDGKPEATVTGNPKVIGIVGEDVVTVTNGTAYFVDFGAGYGKEARFVGFSITGNDSGNYQLVSQPSAVTADIAKKSVTIEGLSAETREYDGTTDATVCGSPDVKGIIPGDEVSVSYGSAAFDIPDAGNRTVTFTGFGLSGTHSGNYVLQSQPADAECVILPRGITIEGLTVPNKPYDKTSAAQIAGEAVLNGLIKGDDLVLVKGSAAFADPTAGTGKAVSFSGFALGGSDVGNYRLKSQPAPVKADILPLSVRVEGLRALDKTYDGNAGARMGTEVTLVGALEGDSISLSFGAGYFSDPGAGEKKTVTFDGFRIVGKDRANYVLESQPDPVTANILPKAVIVIGLAAYDKAYDGTVDAQAKGTPSLSGVLSGDEVEIVNGTASFADKNAGSNKTVSFSGYSLTGADSGNYVLGSQPSSVYANITPKIIPAPSALVKDRFYDGTLLAEPQLEGGLQGIVENDEVSVSLGTGVYETPDAGSDKRVRFTGFDLEGKDANNYRLAGQPSDTIGNVLPKPVTITPNAVSKTCGDGDPLFTYVVTGLVGSDKITGITCSRLSDDSHLEEAGDVVRIIVSSYDANPNYSVTTETSEMTIEKIPVTVSSLYGVSKAYDGTTSAEIDCGSAIIIGLRFGNVLSVSATGQFDTASAGTDKIVRIIDIVLSGEHSNRYAVSLTESQSHCTADIYQAEVVIEGLGVEDRPYDGTRDATVKGTAILVGIIEGDSVTVSYGKARFDGKNAGNGVTATFHGFSLEGDDSPNYVLKEQPSPATANISPIPVTILAVTANDKVYDGTVSAEVSGIRMIQGKIEGDSVVASGGTASFDDASIGENKTVTFDDFTLSGSDAYNYYVSEQPASATASITPRPLEIKGAEVLNKTYDGTPNATVCGSPYLDGLVDGDTVIIDTGTASFDNHRAGKGKLVTFTGFSISGKDASNYVLSKQPSRVMADIDPAAVTISGLGVNDKVYDGYNYATITGYAVLDGIIGDDNVRLLPGFAEFETTDVGENVAEFRGFSLTGTDCKNYVLEQPQSVTANITPVNVWIGSVSLLEKQYDGTTTAEISGVPELYGILYGDEVSVVNGTAMFDSPKAGSERNVVFDNFTLTGKDAGNYRIATQPPSAKADILPRSVTITGLDVVDKTYDGTDLAHLNDGASLSWKHEGDDVTVQYGTGTYDSSYSGTITLTFDGFSLVGDDASNYVLERQPESMTVERARAPLYVSMNKTIAYDGKIHSVDITEDCVNGLVANDSLIPGRVVLPLPDAGTYSYSDLVSTKLIQTEYGISNYDVVYDITVTVEKAVPNASCFDTDIPLDSNYDGKERTASVGVKNGIVGMGQFSFSFSGIPVDAGTYQITADVEEGSNYKAVEGLVLGLFTINKAKPTFATMPKGVDVLESEDETKLIVPGSAIGGTIVYSMTGDFEDASEQVPVSKKAGHYTVYYKIVGDKNHHDSEIMEAESAIRDWAVSDGCYVMFVSYDDVVDGVPVAEIASLSENGGGNAAVDFGEGSVEFDRFSVSEIADGDGVLSYSVFDPHLYDNMFGNDEAVFGINLSLTDGSGRPVTVSAKIEENIPSDSTLKVYRVSPTGEIKEVPSHMEGNYVVFTATDQSSFVVVVEENEESFPIAYVAVPVSIIGLLAAFLVFFKIRGKRKVV